MRFHIPFAIVASTLIMPAAAWAADSSAPGCPASKERLSIQATLDKIDDRIYSDAEWTTLVIPLIEGVDTNGDGILCSKQFAPNPGQDKQWGALDYVITQISDNKPAGRISA